MTKSIGKRQFYRMLFSIAIPVALQNGITTLVNLIDHLVIGRLGTSVINGVASGGQLLFVLNLLLFGVTSGAGIFGAQFFGNKEYETVRSILRLKIYVCFGVVTLAAALFLGFGEPLLKLYLSEGGTPAGDPAAALAAGKTYLHVMLLGLPPLAVSQALTGTLREAGETGLPMKAGITAVFINLVMNDVLIFGYLGLPEMGVAGAGAATVIARFAELGLILLGIRRRRNHFFFLRGLFSTFRVPLPLVRRIAGKGSPLVADEFLWALGTAAVTHAFSLRGLAVMAALHIANTVFNFFRTLFHAMDTSISVLVGRRLGAGDPETAVDWNRKLTGFSLMLFLPAGALLALCAFLIPGLYHTEEHVRQLAVLFLMIHAVLLPIHGLSSCFFATLRTGGRTWISLLFHSGWRLAVVLPLVLGLIRLTALDSVTVYLFRAVTDVFKALIGWILVKRKIWVRNLTEARPGTRDPG